MLPRRIDAGPGWAKHSRLARGGATVAVVACAAATVLMASPLAASASGLPRALCGLGGGPGLLGRAWAHGCRGQLGVTGTVVNAPGPSAPTSFTMDVAGTGGTTTLVTVEVSTSTALSEPGASTVSLGDVLAGVQAQVYGTLTASTLQATSIFVPSVREEGTVVTAPGASAPTSFTMDVTGTGGTTTLVTVDVPTGTTLSEPGASTALLSFILAGDHVQVSGAQAGTATVTATSVTMPAVRETGTVFVAPGATAPTEFTMNVTGPNGATSPVTVDVQTSTALNEAGAGAVSLSGILAGYQVQVSGTQFGAGMVNATSVSVPAVRELGTVVTAPGASPTSFTMDVAGAGGATTLVTVQVSSTTTLNVQRATAPSWSALVTGSRVEAYGTQAGTNIVDATSVVVSPRRDYRGTAEVANRPTGPGRR